VAVTASLQGVVLEATLERITYANEDSGYIVGKVDTGRVATWSRWWVHC
jgi:exodeoxyribonuclease V alpha subunit